MSSKNIVSEDKFNNKWGFVISCIGSSVGMANIWMFPYRIGEFGGRGISDSVYYLCPAHRLHRRDRRDGFRARHAFRPSGRI